ncbi:Uncharacterized protein TCM_012888 [Theobroma cacao]|uniref:Uncharacterized protein n=1 Tax=Theobroma cacao TaxID=3641 RepID=A0A061G2U5_THECC|nr:Uncharacterized protein TCM_012888 [Theobroma cacao]
MMFENLTDFIGALKSMTNIAKTPFTLHSVRPPRYILIQIYLKLQYLNRGNINIITINGNSNIKYQLTNLLTHRYQEKPFNVPIINMKMDSHPQIGNNNNFEESTIAAINAVGLTKTQNIKYKIRAIITDIDCSNGWFYNSCNKYGLALRFCAEKYWCTQHDEKTPLPT